MPDTEEFGRAEPRINQMQAAAQTVGEIVHELCGPAVVQCLFFGAGGKNFSCPSAAHCPLIRLRYELEHISPAFYGLLARELEPREIMENVAVADFEGDFSQKQESHYRLAVLLEFIKVLFAVLLALYRVAGIPHITQDFILLMESKPRALRLPSRRSASIKAEKFGVSLHSMYVLFVGLPDQNHAFLFDILQIYLCALEVQTGQVEEIDSSEFSDFDWIEEYLRRQRNKT